MKLNLEGWEGREDLGAMEERTLAAFDTLKGGHGPGQDYLGWVDWPLTYDQEEFARMQAAAQKIREDSEVLLVVGIGGSYLGARAVIEALSPAYGRGKPEILYTGNMLSQADTEELLAYLKGKQFSINVISKSGTTTETAVAFRLFRALLEETVGREAAAQRIYVTTDKERGALKTLADEEGYAEFVVPDDIGGRYSVLTAVGLLPIAAAGIDVQALLAGATKEREACLVRDFQTNQALRYAAARTSLYEAGKAIEILVAYEPRLRYLQEWWKQLAGESEGKEGKGLYPSSVSNTTDLHSLGQWIQQGPPNHFETVLWFQEGAPGLVVPTDERNLDGLNYLAGKSLYAINQSAMEGTKAAHVEGGVPNLALDCGPLNADTLGQLIYFFEWAVGISGYLLEVNPFNQPGVEFYKSNMYRLLGKPGY